MLTKRIRARVVECKFPAHEADIAKAQIAAIINFHIAGFHPMESVEERLRKVAFDCYVQGLIDGNQIPPTTENGSAK